MADHGDHDNGRFKQEAPDNSEQIDTHYNV